MPGKEKGADLSHTPPGREKGLADLMRRTQPPMPPDFLIRGSSPWHLPWCC